MLKVYDKKNSLHLLIMSLGIMLLTACGGSGRSSDPVESPTPSTMPSTQPSSVVEQNTTKTKGYLIDSALEGVSYLCDGIEGLTNEKGMFECKKAPVTFKIGALTLGTIEKYKADANVTLQDLLGLEKTNLTDVKLKLLARLVQSLDDDGKIDIKITITDDVRSKITKEQNFSDMSESDVRALLSGLGKTFVPECGALKHLGASVSCDGRGDYTVGNGGGGTVTPPSSGGEKTTITGYVIDDPIENATIELQEINGTLIERFENVTKADGSFNLKIDSKYKNRDFILRAYNGTMLNKAFDGDLYGYHFSGDDLEVNLTPLNTLLLTLSSQFSDVQFSKRVSRAKSLLIETYGIDSDEFNAIKDGEFSAFNIVKFRELVNALGFNALIQTLAGDSVDGYADESDNKLLFSSAKERVLKDAKANFTVVDSNLLSDDISKLNIRGVSEKEDGSTGTMDMMTDVIATRTDIIKDENGNESSKETIVFRSFNVGEWRGKLNEETTLLARIFLDYRLTNLTENVQEKIAKKLLDEKNNDFQKTLKYQDMATDTPFVMPYYIELMEGLRVFALSYISEYSIAKTDKVQAKLAKFSQILKRQNKLYQANEDNLVSMGLLQVRATKEKLEFANYAKVNYGFRAYEIDGVKQDYDYPFFDFKANIINTTKLVNKGGAVGGLYAFMKNQWKFDAEGNELYYNKSLGDNNSFDDITKVKFVIWQPYFIHLPSRI